MKTFFSFVIPVYNTGNVLCRCVDSIMRNNHFEYEILLIDDGSNESTSCLCDDLANNNKNIIVVHTDNKGPYQARITGYLLAKGDYILTPDSDDYFINDFLDKINSYLSKDNIDVLSFNFLNEIDGIRVIGDSHKYSNSVLKDRNLIFSTLFDSFELNQSLCRKCFKRFLLNKIDLTPKTGRMFEDGLFTIKLMLESESAMFVNDALYVYTHDNADSLTKKSYFYEREQFETIHSMLESIEESESILLLNKSKYNSAIINLFLSHVFNLLSNQKQYKDRVALLSRIGSDELFSNIVNATVEKKYLGKRYFLLMLLRLKMYSFFVWLFSLRKKT